VSAPVSSCDEIRAALLLGDDDAAEAHVRGCPACVEIASGLVSLARDLAASAPEGPPPGLQNRVLIAAAPLLREQGVALRRARALDGLRLCAAPALALLLLPVVVYVDFWLVSALYGLLSRVLPAGLDLYLASTYAIFLAGLLALTYASLPLVVERQRHRRVLPSMGGSLHA
jgi:hypothetical protein